MAGDALLPNLPPWSYKSELLTPKPKAYHHLPSEGHHPPQGDKQEKTILPCMWQSSNTIRTGQMPHKSLCCLEGSTPKEREGLSLFIALRWMQDREGVMVWLAENIQACLRIFWQLQHQWIVRDILHLPQGVFDVFVLWHTGPNPSYP